MDIKTHLRSILAQKFIPLVKKDKCEICDSTDRLEVHHETQFIVILEDTLKELNLEIKEDIKDYSEKDLNMITNIILGKHLHLQYLTLCNNCHINIHKNNKIIGSGWDKYLYKLELNKNKKDEERQQYVENTLILYLENIVGVKLYKNEKKELIDIIGLKDTRFHIQKSISQLNAYLFKYNIIINSYTDWNRKIKNNYGKVYWIISKIS